MASKPRGAKGEAWGILNPWGDVWTYDVFQSEEAAHEYLRRFWRDDWGNTTTDLSRFKVVRVKVHVTALPSPSEPQP